MLPKHCLSKKNETKGCVNCLYDLISSCRFFWGGLVPTKKLSGFLSPKKTSSPGLARISCWKTHPRWRFPSCLSTPGAVKAQNQQIFVALPKIRFEATRCQMPTRVATHYHLKICVLQTKKDKNAHKKQIHKVMRFWGDQHQNGKCKIMKCRKYFLMMFIL